MVVAVLQCRLQFLTVYYRHAGRYEFGQTVALRQRQIHHPGHILDSRLGCHGAVGDYVGHLLLAVFAGDVFQHLGAAVVVEVYIDIRQ